MRPGLLRALEHLLLPNACVACERAVEQRTPSALLCGVCRSRLRRLTAGCDRCGQPLPPVGPCRFCVGWPAALRWTTSAVWLTSEARAVIHHLKYDGFHALGSFAASVIVRTMACPAAAVLAPIPLSRRRLRQRGYNQAAMIASALGREWDLPVSTDLLCRRSQARSQTALTPTERRANVAEAFVAVPALATPTPPRSEEQGESVPAPAAVVGRGQAEATIILVDDVLTTGATLSAAAAALETAGWDAVGAVTFARALPFTLKLAGV